MNTEKPIMQLHSEHKEWLNKLSFYKDDLAVLQNRLDDIAGKNSDKDMLAVVEKYQNQLTIQREQIDLLHHEIKKHEHGIEKSIAENPVASDHRKMQDHPEQRDKILRFEEMFADLRKSLLSFAAKWM
ncbi:MAG TPA: hypothetical protein PLC48_09230 [Ferruginibacter sp.]|nr:hypothetical protein [Ferruginibacter sp.]